MAPLQVPGGPELLVIVLILVVPAAILVGVAVALVSLDRRNPDSAPSDAERIGELERRVEELEEQYEPSGDTARDVHDE